MANLEYFSLTDAAKQITDKPQFLRLHMTFSDYYPCVMRLIHKGIAGAVELVIFPEGKAISLDVGMLTAYESLCIDNKWKMNFPVATVNGYTVNPDNICISVDDLGKVMNGVSTDKKIKINDPPNGRTEMDMPMPAYLDTTHPMHSKELAKAIQCWNEVLADNPKRPRIGTRKQLIEKWLAKNCTNKMGFTNAARERITTMINPDGNGGVSKTIEN